MPDVKEELADWIDTNVIAERILEELEEVCVPPTLESGKKIWLDVLENGLSDAIQSAINARVY